MFELTEETEEELERNTEAACLVLQNGRMEGWNDDRRNAGIFVFRDYSNLNVLTDEPGCVVKVKVEAIVFHSFTPKLNQLKIKESSRLEDAV